MEVKIEKGIPIPKTRGRKNEYPFNEMEVGDSFFIDGDDKEASRVRVSFCQMKRRNKNFKKKFTVRKVEGGFRCWRFE